MWVMTEEFKEHLHIHFYTFHTAAKNKNFGMPQMIFSTSLEFWKICLVLFENDFFKLTRAFIVSQLGIKTQVFHTVSDTDIG